MSSKIKRPELARRVVALENPHEHEDSDLDMAKVWEVTAVSAPTCTVQMAFDTTNLMDQVEITGIYFDPNNEPSVGDQGMLLRLGSGAAYFFSGPAPGVSEIAFTATTYYIPTTSRSNVDRARASRQWTAWDTSVDLFQGLIRLASPVTGPKSVALYLCDYQEFGVVNQLTNAFQFGTSPVLKAAAITDVIPADPTYAEFAALAEEASFGTALIWPGLPASPLAGGLVQTRTTPGIWFAVENGVTAYGFRIFIEHQDAQNPSAGYLYALILEGGTNKVLALDVAYPSL